LRNLRCRRLRLRKRTRSPPSGALSQGRTWQVLQTHARRTAPPSW